MNGCEDYKRQKDVFSGNSGAFVLKLEHCMSWLILNTEDRESRSTASLWSASPASSVCYARVDTVFYGFTRGTQNHRYYIVHALDHYMLCVFYKN